MQKGLTFEDFELFSDREMRRDYLFETIMRQGYNIDVRDSTLIRLFYSGKGDKDTTK